MSKKKKASVPEINYDATLAEPLKLRAALLMACTALCDGDPLAGWDLSERFYDEAELLIAELTDDEVRRLPGGNGVDGKVIKFPS